jgi:hypothetical protein
VLPSLALANEQQPFLRLLGDQRNRQDEPGQNERSDAQNSHAKQPPKRHLNRTAGRPALQLDSVNKSRTVVVYPKGAIA